MTEGHPDKICDQIADTVLDEILKKENTSRVACEVIAGMGTIFITGEITTKAYVNYDHLARNVLKDAGYDKPSYGFDYHTVGVLSSIHEQSPDIARGVRKTGAKRQGAGDQGMMSGYATNETKEFMPLPILLASRLARQLAEVRKKGILKYLRPDGKTQVTIEYEDETKPKRVDTIVVSAQHEPDVSLSQIRKDIKKSVIEPICGKYLDKHTRYYINNTGRFVIGGPVADTGCTGRKIIADTYGGIGGHGGGAFSGKDPTKVDRSGAYAARYMAKNIVANGLADRCEIQIAYVIAGTKPLSIMIDTFGTEKISKLKIMQIIKSKFPLSPVDIIRELKLLQPIYRQVSCYGHFGRTDLNLSWEEMKKI
jgi:S-adenosylmethionine synthetase